MSRTDAAQDAEAEMMRVMDECALWAPTDYRKRETAKAFLQVAAKLERARLAGLVRGMRGQLGDAMRWRGCYGEIRAFDEVLALLDAGGPDAL